MRKVPALVLLAIATMIMGLAFSPPAPAATVGNSDPQSGKIVSDDPANFTPHILNGTVYSVVQVGDMIVVGGNFTQVRSATSSAVMTRNRVFAFNATTGVISTSFNPNPNNTVYKVQAAADGESVYVGGRFGSAYGVSMPSRLFKANVNTGARDATFRPGTISGDIRDLEVIGNRLWVAGKFTHIAGVAQKALGTINATTGVRDPYFTGLMAGTHRDPVQYPSDRTNVLQISSNPTNTELVAVGNFTSVDGSTRSQIAKFDLTGTSKYALAPWYTSLFTSSCSRNFETIMTDVEYSPNGQFFVVSTTAAWGGMSSATGGNGCDVVARFETSSTSPTSRASWTAYTGGDSTWTVEVTDDVVYAGGHQSWQNNPIGRNEANQGAVSRPGIAALDTINGMAYSWNPTRTRGVGVQDMLATSQGLWVGSDTDRIGNYEYHGNIALMPLQGGKTLPVMSNPALPATVYSVAAGGSQLQQRSFTGTTAPAPVSSTDSATNRPSWSTTVGAFMTNNTVYSATSNGQVTKRSFNGTSWGTPSVVSTADQLVYQSDWHNTDVPAMRSFFYADGWIYYTRSDQNALLSRGFEVESDIVGQQRYTSATVSGIDFRTIRGAFVANDKFYYANTSGQLFQADWGGRAPVAGTQQLLSGAGAGWAARALFVHTGEGSPPPPPPPPPPPDNKAPTAVADVSCEQLVCSYDGTDSTDSDGTIDSYAWNFGDGGTSTAASGSHPYSGSGPRTVTLTVTDDDGATSVATRNINPSDAASPVDIVGAASTAGNRSNHAVTIPGTVQAGDALVLFFAANTTNPTYTPPAGWTQIETVNGNGVLGRAWTKVATAADAGTSVRVTSSAFAKSNIAVAAYRGTDTTTPVAVSANRLDNGGAAHTSPTVTAPDDTGWLVTYWSDKSSGTTSWDLPAGQTQRAIASGSGSGTVSGVLADSNGAVSGSVGGLTATANTTSSRGISFSVVLH